MHVPCPKAQMIITQSRTCRQTDNTWNHNFSSSSIEKFVFVYKPFLKLQKKYFPSNILTYHTQNGIQPYPPQRPNHSSSYSPLNAISKAQCTIGRSKMQYSYICGFIFFAWGPKEDAVLEEPLATMTIEQRCAASEHLNILQRTSQRTPEYCRIAWSLVPIGVLSATARLSSPR